MKDLFRPLIETPMNKVRVVILGLEPPSMMDCDGLAYSYPRAFQDADLLPTALQNIFEEYTHDLSHPMPKSGSLKRWADQGVLLWNQTPSVRQGFPRSHANIGWDSLTREILIELYKRNKNTVFIFFTPKKENWVDFMPQDAKIVDCGSPAFVNITEFWGSSPFTKANAMLKAAGQNPINWRLA